MDQLFREEINRLHAQICAGLADPTRILLLYTLSEKNYSVSELVAKLDLNQPSVSRHLQVLRARNLVTSQREGNNVIYSLTDNRIIQALDLIRAVLTDLLKKQAALIEAEEALKL
jgi:DNA-binding transcriptional ArsR family regulator